jgi:hypothetical protein
MVGRTGKTHLSVERRPLVLDTSPLCQLRPLHLLPNRDRLLALMRQLMLRLVGSAERAIGSTVFLVSGRSKATHHMERVEGRATRSPFVPFATARTKSTLARGQPSSGDCTQSPYVPVANHDGRTSETLGTRRH